MATGYIYIMTNPAFEEYVKIGYATDVKQRRDELSRSTSVPFSFRIYATYEVDFNEIDPELPDKKLHKILDKLNPNLRSIEEIDGKIRKREFYAIKPEDVYIILEAIAGIHGYEKRLKKWEPTDEERQDEKTAQEIKKRMAPFTFSMCHINKGKEIEFWRNKTEPSGITCTVDDDKHVKYNGERLSLSALAQRLLGAECPVNGTEYFKYDGKWLNDIRRNNGN